MTPPAHHELFARMIHNDDKVSVSRVLMTAHGGAEISEHFSEHIFYILRGGAKMFDGKETYEVEAGESIVVGSNEPHSLTGNGREDCEYLVVTAPPLG